MAVSAKQLSKSGARGKDLDALVREHLQIIDDKLLHADRTWGRNVVTYDLPVSLTLPGLEKKDGQRIVYSAILRSLQKRGFEARILLIPDRTTIFIAWMTDLDVTEVEAMNALIRAARITEAEVPKFIQTGALPAPRSAIAAREGRAEPAPPMRVAGEDLEMRPRGGVKPEAGAATRPTPAPASSAEAAILAAAK
jgi:hypothetical protein